VSEPQIHVVTVPSIFGIAMQVAPFVRRQVITEREGRWLVSMRYRLAILKAEGQEGWMHG
jgi:hypothetical protein